MAKTIIALGKAPSKEQKELLVGLRKTFGMPEKTKQRENGDIEYDWKGASVQLYLSPNDKVGLFIQLQDLPNLEFDKVSVAVAQKRLQTWCAKALKGFDKQIEAIEKSKERMESLRRAAGFVKPKRPRPTK